MDAEKTDPTGAPPPYMAQQGAPYPNQPMQQGMYPGGAPPQYPPGSYPQPQPIAGQPYNTAAQYGGYHPATGYAQSARTTVVMSQPVGYVSGVVAAPPNHMALSVLTCLFCFWPLGLVAIIKSNEVDNAVRRGDLAAASEASQSARRFSMWSIGCGIAIYVMFVFIIIIQVALVAG